MNAIERAQIDHLDLPFHIILKTPMPYFLSFLFLEITTHFDLIIKVY